MGASGGVYCIIPGHHVNYFIKVIICIMHIILFIDQSKSNNMQLGMCELCKLNFE